MESDILVILASIQASIQAQNARFDAVEARLEKMESQRSNSSEEPSPIMMSPEASEVNLHSEFFGNSERHQRRKSVSISGVQRQQHIPAFKGNINGELNITTAFAFVQDSEKYVRFNPDAYFQAQMHMSDKNRDIVIGSSSVLTLESFDMLELEQFNKYLLRAVAPTTPSEFLQGFRDLVKYQISWNPEFMKRYFSATDWKTMYTYIKLVVDAAIKAYTMLVELALEDRRIIPLSKPDPQHKGESLVEAFEELIPIVYAHMLKKRQADKFTQLKVDFLKYVRLYQAVNEEVYLTVRPTFSLQQQMTESNRRFREDERMEKSIKQQMSTRKVDPKIHAVVHQDDTHSIRQHSYAGGKPYDIEDDIRDMLDAEDGLLDEQEDFEEQEQSEDVLPLNEPQQAAVQAVRFSFDNKKSVTPIVKPKEYSKPKEICWSFTFNKGKCSKGSICPNFHDAVLVSSKMAELSAFWSDEASK